MRSVRIQCLSPLFVFYIWSFPIYLTFLFFFSFRMVVMQKNWLETRAGMPPLSLSKEELHSPDDIYLGAEQEILLKINGGHTSALTASLPVYFVCNTCIQYPKECMNVYMFLQRYVLNVYESVTLAANQSITAFK